MLQKYFLYTEVQNIFNWCNWSIFKIYTASVTLEENAKMLKKKTTTKWDNKVGRKYVYDGPCPKTYLTNFMFYDV